MNKQTTAEQGISPVNIYYNNQMHKNYKIEERVLKELISSNIKCVNPNQRVNIIFYYKNRKTANLVMKNNLNANPSLLQQTNVVYSFQCPLPHCKAEKYIGLTQTTLSRRLTMHAQTGSVFQHFKTCHQTKPTRNQLTDNTTIIARAENRFKLSIKEALLILYCAPSINKQFDNFTSILKLHAHKNNSHSVVNAHIAVSPNSTHTLAMQSSLPITANIQRIRTYPTSVASSMSQQDVPPHPTSPALSHQMPSNPFTPSQNHIHSFDFTHPISQDHIHSTSGYVKGKSNSLNGSGVGNKTDGDTSKWLPFASSNGDNSGDHDLCGISIPLQLDGHSLPVSQRIRDLRWRAGNSTLNACTTNPVI